MANKDNIEISIAKAIGIILMVLGHSGIQSFVHDFIYMFHMPLFFLLSGYLFKEKYLTDANTFIRRRIKTLYFPFVIWSVLFLLLHNLFFDINIYNLKYGYTGGVPRYSSVDIWHHFLDIVTKMQGSDELLGTFWFLKALFFGSLISYFALKICPKPFVCIIILTPLFILSSHFRIWIPYIIVGALECYSAILFLLGFWYKKSGYHLEQKWWCACLGLFSVIIGTLYWPGEITGIGTRKLIPYTTSAIGGSLMVLFISHLTTNANTQKIKNSLIYIGNNTMIVLVLHFLSFKLVSLIIIKLYGLSIDRLAEFPIIKEYATQGWWILYLIVGVGIPIGIKLIWQELSSKIQVFLNIKGIK